MSEIEPMSLREAIKYGFQEHKEHAAELKYREEHGPQYPRGFCPYAIVPSMQEQDPIIGPGLRRAANAIYEISQQAAGKPYDHEAVAENDLRNLRRERFMASKWRRLFPRIANMERKTIYLNI